MADHRHDAAPTLGAIGAVTLAVASVDDMVAAYRDELNYRVVMTGIVSDASARSWQSGAMTGRRCAILAPESGEAVYLRFVESPAAAGWRALTTQGWNATEIVVQDVDGLAARLGVSSRFTIIGEPKGLTRFPMIRAMQAIGPAGECLYFTEVGAGSGLNLAPALSPVGRVFIVVAGGDDLDAMFGCYAGFANHVDPPVATPVTVISAANNMPLDTLHEHGLIKLPGGTMIELDRYPSLVKRRAVVAGELPPGMAITSFTATSAAMAEWGDPVEALLPGRGIAACRRGAAGELIELVAEDI